MKKSTFLLTLAPAVLICLNIVLLYTISIERNENWRYKLLLQTSNDSIKLFETQNDDLLQSISLMFDYQYGSIDKNIFFLDENNNKISIKQVIRERPMLVFKYSTLSCNVCINEQISLLKKTSKEIGSENILILADYNSPRDLSRFLRMNQIDFRVLNQGGIELTTIDKRMPYYFILDVSLSLKNLYIPIQGDTSLTQHYFNKISERYFKENSCKREE